MQIAAVAGISFEEGKMSHKNADDSLFNV